MTLVNLGSGPHKLPGFVNVDLDAAGRPDVVADLSRQLPFADACADAIFTEDFVAQLEPDALLRFLAECRRMLKPGGTLRVLTPDLKRFMRMYLGMKLAGRWQYDVETFARIAAKAGLDTATARYNESRHPALRGIDLRKPDE